MLLNHYNTNDNFILGPALQSIVSLTSSLVVKMLTVLVRTISNSQVFFAEKNVSSFCKCKSYSHFSSKNISLCAVFDDQRFNDTLTNDIISFEQISTRQLKQPHKNHTRYATRRKQGNF